MLSLADVTEPKEAIGRRARKASALALFAGCSVLVFHQDVDGPVSGVADARTTAWTAVSEAIAAGAQHAELNGEGIAALACIAAAPLRTIETWLLADPGALSSIAEPGSENLGTMLDDPEGLWGIQKNPASQHPKLLFRRAVGGPNRKVGTKHYHAAAQAVALDSVETTCPVSFSPFRQTVASLIV